jgi:hypothetical protein
MKLPILVIAFFFTFINANVLPGFHFQDYDNFDYLQDSTKLITNCGDENDLLT